MILNRTWYRRWFGDAYKKLYPHRDFLEAEAQIRFLLRALPVTSEWRILDIGCGQGRHLEILRRNGFRSSLGFDLSMPLLRDARAASLMVARGDMRRPPFRRHGFDLVTSFFTSFGYFATFEEDVEALSQFVSILKPGGYLFLDLINRENLVRSLVPEDMREIEGAQVIQRRRMEGDVVIKEIEIRRPGSAPENFQERVRLYGPEDMAALADRFSLRQAAVFGDETGRPYDPEGSQRMALLLQAPPGGTPAGAAGR